MMDDDDDGDDDDSNRPSCVEETIVCEQEDMRRYP